MSSGFFVPNFYNLSVFYLTKCHNVTIILIATKLGAIRGRMKLSSKTKYGLKACHFLGLSYPKEVVSASSLESMLSVSGKYLEKIMRTLSKRGIVGATRGANGGYYLLKHPKHITVGQIVRALEDEIELIECVKEDGKCKCCPSSGVWKRLHKGINDILDSMTIEQMIKGELQ